MLDCWDLNLTMWPRKLSNNLHQALPQILAHRHAKSAPGLPLLFAQNAKMWTIAAKNVRKIIGKHTKSHAKATKNYRWELVVKE